MAMVFMWLQLNASDLENASVLAKLRLCSHRWWNKRFISGMNFVKIKSRNLTVKSPPKSKYWTFYGFFFLLGFFLAKTNQQQLLSTNRKFNGLCCIFMLRLHRYFFWHETKPNQTLQSNKNITPSLKKNTCFAFLWQHFI